MRRSDQAVLDGVERVVDLTVTAIGCALIGATQDTVAHGIMMGCGVFLVARVIAARIIRRQRRERT